MRFLCGGSDGKKSFCNAGDTGSIAGSEGFPGKGNGYPLQYSSLENSLDRGAWHPIHGIGPWDCIGYNMTKQLILR